MLTVGDLRGHITTELDDEPLQALLDAAYEAITNHAGAEGDITELITPGPGDLLMLARPATEVTSVVECDTTLATDDYEVVGSQLLRRLSDGTNTATRWRGRVKVVYPSPLDAERDRVAIALVRLDIDYSPGIKSERIGDWSEERSGGGEETYASMRTDILASLDTPMFA